MSVLTSFLVVVLVFGMFAGCSSDKKVSTGGTFTYWVAMDNNVAQTHTSLNDDNFKSDSGI